MLIALLPGDGIGPEAIAEARRVLDAMDAGLSFEEAPVGGAAYKAEGHPLPPRTLELAKRADAVLFGAVGDPRATGWRGICGRSRRSSGFVRSWGCSPTFARPGCSTSWRTNRRCGRR